MQQPYAQLNDNTYYHVAFAFLIHFSVKGRNMNPMTRMMKQDPLKYAFYLLFIGVLILIVVLRVYFVLW